MVLMNQSFPALREQQTLDLVLTTHQLAKYEQFIVEIALNILGVLLGMFDWLY